MLSAMRRPYTSAQYAATVDEIRARLPHAGITADVIVGFPGETDEDVETLVQYLETSPLTQLHVFPYSDRPGTEARRCPRKVHGTAVRATRRARAWPRRAPRGAVPRGRRTGASAARSRSRTAASPSPTTAFASRSVTVTGGTSTSAYGCALDDGRLVGRRGHGRMSRGHGPVPLVSRPPACRVESAHRAPVARRVDDAARRSPRAVVRRDGPHALDEGHLDPVFPAAPAFRHPGERARLHPFRRALAHRSRFGACADA